MQLQFHGDGKGFKIHIEGTWRTVMALIGAVVLVFSAPGITRLGSILGWW